MKAAIPWGLGAIHSPQSFMNRKTGFSLVETAIALSITSFCMLSLIGLIPVGLLHYQHADNQSIIVNLTTSVVRDLESTPLSSTSLQTSPRFQFIVPYGGGPIDQTPQTAYVDGSGAPTKGLSDANTLYRLSVSFFPPSGGLKTSTMARVMVSFPARADTATGKYTSMFQTMISLDRN